MSVYIIFDETPSSKNIDKRRPRINAKSSRDSYSNNRLKKADRWLLRACFQGDGEPQVGEVTRLTG